MANEFLAAYVLKCLLSGIIMYYCTYTTHEPPNESLCSKREFLQEFVDMHDFRDYFILLNIDSERIARTPPHPFMPRHDDIL